MLKYDTQWARVCSTAAASRLPRALSLPAKPAGGPQHAHAWSPGAAASGAEALASAWAREAADAAAGALPEGALADVDAPLTPRRPNCARLSKLVLFAPYGVGLIDLERPEQPFVFADQVRRGAALWSHRPLCSRSDCRPEQPGHSLRRLQTCYLFPHHHSMPSCSGAAKRLVVRQSGHLIRLHSSVAAPHMSATAHPLCRGARTTRTPRCPCGSHWVRSSKNRMHTLFCTQPDCCISVFPYDSSSKIT